MALRCRDRRNDAGGSQPCFEGAGQLFSLVGQLYRRPSVGDRPCELDSVSMKWAGQWPRQQRSGRRGLPIVCLVRPPSHQDLLTAIGRQLAQARPRGVRYAYLHETGTETADVGVDTVRDILTEAARELTGNTIVRDRGLRFKRFSLVVWLMNERLDEHDPYPERTLLTRIRERGLALRFSTAAQNFDNAVPDNVWWRALSFLLQGVAAVLFQVAVSGRVPVLSGRYRWFLRQPHLAPELSGSFPRFARRLTLGERDKEAPEYVKRLMVNAFLEDLRRAYRFRPWRVLQKHRITYPVLLLDDVTAANGGYEVLRLFNEVRNQVGLFDPLLVISGSSEVPPDAGRTDPTRPKYDAPEAGGAYIAWQNSLPMHRLARDNTAWYLPIRIRDGESEAARKWWRGEGAGGYQVTGRAARAPWWTSRGVRVLAPFLVMATASGLAVDSHHEHCGTWDSSLTLTGKECVGVSGGPYTFLPDDPSFRQVEEKIHQQNREAEKQHRKSSGRPYITLVALQALTSSDGTADGLTAERETLEGFAVAQWRQLKGSRQEPIVRILIGNAGEGMRQGEKVAKRLGELARKDKSIVGVVGLDASSKATQATITQLTKAGLPMVASTLSADQLVDSSPMYFQVAPKNEREAQVVAAFVNKLAKEKGREQRPRQVRVYYSSDPSDYYSTNLSDDARKAFEEKDFKVATEAFVPEGGASGGHGQDGRPPLDGAYAAGQDTCRYEGYVFFAGRGVPDYGEFLDGAASCESKAVFIGDDDVTRHVADGAARRNHSAPPYYYVSFAPEPTRAKGAALNFYRPLNDLFGFEGTEKEGRSRDGHAALAYDAAQVMIAATRYLRQSQSAIPVTPGAVWREITAIHSSTSGSEPVNNHIDGVTGTIDYGGDISRRVPENKPVAVLRVEEGNVDEDVLNFCGRAKGPAPGDWCPPGDRPGDRG